MEHFFKIPNKPLDSDKFKLETGWQLFTNDAGDLIISGDCTKAQAQAALTSHDGTRSELTISEKLASVGLSIDDLKVALGI
jgi:hypothetical protein